jgi:molybdopterin-synthase adenylyltransferase
VTILPGTRPRLPSHYYVLYEPPDNKGDESLIFISERRKVKIKGTLFREFLRNVVPLLDGKHTVAEIQSSAADLFPPQEVTAALELLAQQHILTEDPETIVIPAGQLVTLTPQLNFFHEITRDAYIVQERLSKARVALLGAGGPGSTVAVGLAAAGVGSLRLLDNSVVLETDGYFNPVFTSSSRGQKRAAVLQAALQEHWPHIEIETSVDAIGSEDEMLSAITGSDFVVCCADRGQGSALYQLNRAALRAGIPWLSCAVSGFEAVIGPTVRPHDTPCYLCYTMRSVACSEYPEEDFSFRKFLDYRKQDDSGRRENFVFAVGMAAQLAGLETLKYLTGIVPPATLGSILVFNVLETTVEKHTVLRHPKCPVCFPPEPPLSKTAAPAELAEAGSAR